VEGEPAYGRVVNTASEAFLVGSAGQPNYSAAKAGIAALTVAAARGVGRYGVRVNAICPRARTAMTEGVFGDAPEAGVDPLSVDHVAPFVAFLASPAAEKINGQVFVVHGGMVALLRPPTVEQRFDTGGRPGPPTSSHPASAATSPIEIPTGYSPPPKSSRCRKEFP
jgi:3-oxoacyl-[acyl-carrier protein] reductase